MEVSLNHEKKKNNRNKGNQLSMNQLPRQPRTHGEDEPAQSQETPSESIPEKTPENIAAVTSTETSPTVVQLPPQIAEPSVTNEEKVTLEETVVEDASPSEPQTEGESAGDALKAAIAAESSALPTDVTDVDGITKVVSEEEVEEEEEDKKQPAVVLIDEKPSVEEKKEKEPVPSLLTMEVENLMEVFGYLDPMDILNTAQINLTMYTKVDNIFGISEDGQTPPTPTPAPKPKPAPQPQQSSQSKAPPTAATASSGTTQSTQATPTKTKSNPSSPSSAALAGGPLGKGLFSMLQPAAKPTPSASGSTRSGGSAAPSQPLNAKVAQSMASKLSDAELAAIISMTDKLSKLEKEVHNLRNDKEVLAAKLEGTEAVKQFLIGKVRDVEVKLNRSREDEIKVTQQIASDQEVIAFLDSRVQELEQQTLNLTKEHSAAQAELDALKVSTSKKITMLSDMLKYEREKVREDEGEWKATKKVLVKEVKSCRAQILTLQAERDGLKGQNDMLKRAINSSGSTANSNRSPARRKYT